MPERSHSGPRYRRNRRPNPLRPRTRKPVRILSRSVSEPLLFTIKLLSTDDDDDGGIDGDAEVSRGTFLLRPQSFIDWGFFSSTPVLPLPSPARPNFNEETKVVVSVTVEGSPGPVRAMVKLGATVHEAIGVVVERYKREGRCPKLDLDTKSESFQLHHSHFSLESLNKHDKIGEVGSRSFYLRKSCSRSNSFNSASEASGNQNRVLDGRIQPLPPHAAQLFFSFIARRLSKIKRRTKKLWRFVACF